MASNPAHNAWREPPATCGNSQVQLLFSLTWCIVVYAEPLVNVGHLICRRPLVARVWALMAADDQPKPVVTQEGLHHISTATAG